MSGPEISYRIDAMHDGERPFVLKSWARSARLAPKSLRMPREAHYLYQRDLIDRILGRGALVLVARDVDQPVYLYAFLVAERVECALVVHFAFTRRDWRGQGLARALLGEAIERLGSGASELHYTHSADRVVDASAEERARTGQRSKVDTGLTRWLERTGFAKVDVEELLRGDREAA